MVVNGSEIFSGGLPLLFKVCWPSFEPADLGFSYFISWLDSYSFGFGCGLKVIHPESQK